MRLNLNQSEIELYMYIFSATAVSDKELPGFKAGSKIPFIVYVDFKDMYGAEKLCQILLFKEGFKEIHIEKRKLIPHKKITSKMLANDKALAEAKDSGYMIQMFDAH